MYRTCRTDFSHFDVSRLYPGWMEHEELRRCLALEADEIPRTNEPKSLRARDTTQGAPLNIWHEDTAGCVNMYRLLLGVRYKSRTVNNLVANPCRSRNINEVIPALYLTLC